MAGDRNFQQIWDFRSRDDDVDSSSDDSKSSNKVQPNHELASALILAGNDETSDDPNYQKIDQSKTGEGVQKRKPKTKRLSTAKPRGEKKKTEKGPKKEVGKKTEKGPKKEVGKKTEKGIKKEVSKKTEKGPRKEVGKKKRKYSALNHSSLNGFNIFRESIIQDLKVQREQMFARMKEDMQKLVSVKSGTRETAKTKGRKRICQTRHKKSTELDTRPQNCTERTLERSIPDSNNCSHALQERVDCDQAIQTISLNKTEKEEHKRLLAKQSLYSSIQSDQLSYPSYLTLPTASAEKQIEQQTTESPFGSCIKAGVAGNSNGTSLTFDRGNVAINAMNHFGCVSGSQMEVPFPSFAQFGSKNMNFYGQHCAQTSTMGNVFQLPLHQRVENSFNTPSQGGNLSQGNNILGWKMNGGAIRLSGNGHAISGNISGNNFRNHIYYKTNGEVSEYGVQDLGDGSFN